MENETIEEAVPLEKQVQVFNGDFAYVALTVTVTCTYLIINTLLFVV
jgi:hypothetical protein